MHKRGGCDQYYAPKPAVQINSPSILPCMFWRNYWKSRVWIYTEVIAIPYNVCDGVDQVVNVRHFRGRVPANSSHVSTLSRHQSLLTSGKKKYVSHQRISNVTTSWTFTSINSLQERGRWNGHGKRTHILYEASNLSITLTHQTPSSIDWGGNLEHRHNHENLPS